MSIYIYVQVYDDQIMEPKIFDTIEEARIQLIIDFVKEIKNFGRYEEVVGNYPDEESFLKACNNIVTNSDPHSDDEIILNSSFYEWSVMLIHNYYSVQNDYTTVCGQIFEKVIDSK